MDVPDTLRTVATFSPDQLILLVALAAIGLAGFAIYAVHSLARRKDKDK